jgi:hypothetical protein
MAVPAGGFEPPPPNRPPARAAAFRNNAPNPHQLPVVDSPHIVRMQDIVFGRVFFRLRAQNLTGLICGAIMLFVSRQSDGIPGAYVCYGMLYTVVIILAVYIVFIILAVFITYAISVLRAILFVVVMQFFFVVYAGPTCHACVCLRCAVDACSRRWAWPPAASSSSAAPSSPSRNAPLTRAISYNCVSKHFAL